MKDFGKDLRDWRKRNGYTQIQMADKLHKHVNTYAKLERGEIRLNSDYVQLLTPILGDDASLVLGYGAIKQEDHLLSDINRIRQLESVIEEKDKQIKQLEDKINSLMRENKLLEQIKGLYEATFSTEPRHQD